MNFTITNFRKKTNKKSLSTSLIALAIPPLATKRFVIAEIKEK